MPRVDRRRFLAAGTAWLAGTTCAQAFWPFGSDRQVPAGPTDIRGHVFKGDAPVEPGKWSCEAYRYKKLKAGKTVCGVCPHHCLLSPGDRSACRSKVNIDGTLYSLAYGNPCAVHIDPVEKKPLYHFLPGAPIFSLAAAGCNFRCLNCQNWEISQFAPDKVRTTRLMPGEAVDAARQAGAAGIAYTYAEPVTFIEYMAATAQLARPAGLKNILVSNGYINPLPLKSLCAVLDGANINLKAFDDGIYRRLNGGRLAPVLKTFEVLKAHGVHFEMTNLVVPGYVDDPEMVKRMCAWILDRLGPDHPLHFLRFFPRYKLERLPPTPVAVLDRLRDMAIAEGIHHVYVGNVPGHPGNHTYCPSCHRLVIERLGYRLPQYHLDGDRCRFCGTVIAGVWPKHSPVGD